MGTGTTGTVANADAAATCKSSFANDRKRGINRNDPALLFDKKSSDSIELLKIPEVAVVLKISASGVRRLMERRHLPYFKVGGSVRFSKADLASYLERQRVRALD